MQLVDQHSVEKIDKPSEILWSPSGLHFFASIILFLSAPLQ